MSTGRKILCAIALIAVMLVFGFSCGKDPDPVQRPIPSNILRFSDLSKQLDGHVLVKSTGARFTGTVSEVWPNGNQRLKISYKNGWQDGPARGWHENGDRGLESEWLHGAPVGVVREWSSDGMALRETEYQNGKIVREETLPTAEAQKQIDAKILERATLDEQEWQAEVSAQEYEATFVNLWDRLREANHAWKIFQQFQFESIAWGKPGAVQAHDWDVEEQSFAAPNDAISFAQWQALLTGWSRTHRVVETEWHQEQFDPSSNGNDASKSARSLFKVVIHAAAKDGTERIILRAAIRVEWSANKDEGGFWLPNKLEVTQLTLLRRRGSVPFKATGQFDIRRDNPRFSLERFPHTIDPAPLIVRDLNADGLPEIIFSGANLVYWNRGHLNFKPEPLINGFSGAFPNASVVADFNGDARPDLFTVGPRGKPLMFGADKGNRFPGPPQPSLINIQNTLLTDPATITVGDVDGDGDLDAFVPQYLYPYAGGRTPEPYYDSRDGLPAYLLINDGKGIFTDATESAGLAPKRRRRSYSASLQDLDGDRDLDLIVVSDFAGLDLYLNNGDGKFTDITERLGDSKYSFGMSHALGDFDGDGNLDIYMTGMGSTTARRLEHMGLGRKGFESIQSARMKMGYGNRLLLGDGKANFKQIASNDLVARTGWAWGCTQWDFDNDGDRDLFITNGHISGKSAKDYCSTFWRHDIYTPKTQNTGIVMQGLFQACKTNLGKTESWNGFEHNVFYLNEGNGQYTNIAFLMGLASEADSRSVVSADLDLDGRPDLLVVEIENASDRRDGNLRIFQNQLETTNNWIGVHLQNVAGKALFGAKVTLHHKTHPQTLPLICGDSWKAQHPTTLHFGLGKNEAIEAIEVLWPDGKTTRLDSPAINRYHVIKPAQ